MERNEVQKLLYEKLQQEQELFLAELREKPFEEYLWYAQEIAVRDNILFIFGENTSFTMEELKEIAKMKSPLAELYEEWRSMETDEMEILRNVISYTAGEKIKSAAMNKNKGYQKTNKGAR